MTFEVFARDIERRRRGLGELSIPRNAGKLRTASKRVLLAAIDKTGATW